LLELHERRPTPEHVGEVERVTRQGEPVWVVRRREGERRIELRLGDDDRETRKRAKALKKENEDLGKWRERAARRVNDLRGARIGLPDELTARVMKAVAHTDFFAAGGVFGGVEAFRLYEMEIGRRMPAPWTEARGDLVLMTPDGEVQIEARTALTSRLGDLGIGNRHEERDGEVAPGRFIVENRAHALLVGPVRREGETSYKDGVTGETVCAAPHLEFAMREPITALMLHGEGICVRIPAPARYALHALLARELVPELASEGDVGRAAWLIERLADDRPEDLASAWDELREGAPDAERIVLAGLGDHPEAAAALQRRPSTETPGLFDDAR
jgi:hypothetical protein